MSFFEILKAFLPLVLIVGLLYGVLFFVKKYGISFKGKKFNTVPIDVLNSQMIMPKKFISVVRVENNLLVLGVSEHSITLLKELDLPPEKIEETNTKSPYGMDKNNFLDVLKKNLGMK